MTPQQLPFKPLTVNQHHKARYRIHQLTNTYVLVDCSKGALIVGVYKSLEDAEQKRRSLKSCQ